MPIFKTEITNAGLAKQNRRSRPHAQGGSLLIRQRFCWGVFLLAISVGKIRGQDALLSAVSLDNAINNTATLESPVSQPTGFQIGAAHVTCQAYAGATYNDNINYAQTDPQSDTVSQFGVNAGIDWQATDHSTLHFGSGLGYVHYARFSSNDGLEVSPGSVLTYAISVDDVTLTFYDQLSYSREISTEASLANLTTLPQFDNVVGVRSEWNPGHWTFQLAYSHDDYLSDAANEFLNRSSEYVFAKAGWVVAAATQFGVEVSGSTTTYQIAGQANNDSVSLGGYAEWQLLSSLHLTLRGGPTLYELYYPASRGGGTSQLNSYYVTLDVQHQLTDFLSQNLHVERDVQPGLSQGSDYVEQLTASYSLNYALTQNLNVTGAVNLENGSQPSEQFFRGIPYLPYQVTENYQRYGGSLQLAWQITGHLSSSVGYQYWQRDSNLADRGYAANSYNLNFYYSF